MRSITLDIARSLSSIDGYTERMHVLKDKYLGETAYVVSCGPSINDVWSEDLRIFLDDKLCVGVKQAVSLAPRLFDMYLFNPIHLNEYDGELAIETIRVSACDAITLERHENSQRFWRRVVDIYGDIKRTRLVDSLVSRCNFDAADMSVCGLKQRPWGPGLLLDIGLFLLKWMGVRRIIVFGWDMFKGNTYEHYYGGNTIVDRENLMTERDMMVQMAPKLVEWFERSGVELRLCSPRSVLPIPQVKIEDVLKG